MIKPGESRLSSRNCFAMSAELHEVYDAASILAFDDVVPKRFRTPALAHFGDIVAAFEINLLRIRHR